MPTNSNVSGSRMVWCVGVWATSKWCVCGPSLFVIWAERNIYYLLRFFYNQINSKYIPRAHNLRSLKTKNNYLLTSGATGVTEVTFEPITSELEVEHLNDWYIGLRDITAGTTTPQYRPVFFWDLNKFMGWPRIVLTKQPELPTKFSEIDIALL